LKSRIPWPRVLAEGAVIVASILLAFGIDAWGERVQQAGDRATLVENLLEDFQVTRDRAAEGATHAEEMIARTDGFLMAVGSDELIPLDSMRYLALGPFLTMDFQPTLGTYQAAISTGALQLLEGPDLKRAFSAFDEAVRYLELRSDIFVEEYNTGPTAAVRAEFGSIRVLYWDSVPYRQVSESEYRRIASSPSVTGAMEGLLVLIINLRSGLFRIEERAADVIEALQAIR
jgi:hypothetical protein